MSFVTILSLEITIICHKKSIPNKGNKRNPTNEANYISSIPQNCFRKVSFVYLFFKITKYKFYPHSKGFRNNKETLENTVICQVLRI